MASEKYIPINPEILIWARKRLNMSTEYAADKIKVKEEKITEWENGTAYPTYKQLEKLAYNVFKLSIEVFFYPETPKLPKPDVKLRAVYGQYLQETPTEILLVMNSAEAMQEKLRELCLEKNPSGNLITRQKIDGSISEKAEKLRELLSAPLSEQTELRDYYKALRYWRAKSADAGVYIFKENFRNSSYSGFCLDDPEFPIIYLNSIMTPQRQIFTIFHELYHLIENKSGIDFFDDVSMSGIFSPSTVKTEKECNDFASEFLVPSYDFNQTIADNKKMRDALEGGYLDIRRNCINPLSKRYSVSADMILLKLIKNGYLDESDYNLLKSEYDKDSKRQKDGGGDYYKNIVSNLGEKYIDLVREKQAEYGFEDYAAAEYLGVKTKSLEGIEQILRGK